MKKKRQVKRNIKIREEGSLGNVKLSGGGGDVLGGGQTPEIIELQKGDHSKTSFYRMIHEFKLMDLETIISCSFVIVKNGQRKSDTITERNQGGTSPCGKQLLRIASELP